MLKVKADITSLKRETNTRTTQEEQLANALETVRRLIDLATAAQKELGVVRDIFDHVNTRQYLNFETIQPKKRKLQAASGGVVTFGDATPPVELYNGPMGRQHLKDFYVNGAGTPLRNASRDDKTAIELFVAGVRGWEAGLRRQMDDGKTAAQ